MLDDYAALARAALALFEATGEPGYLEAARAAAVEAQALFGAPDGGLFLTAADAADGPAFRPRIAHDGATPSGVGLMAEVFARLYHLTDEPVWREVRRAPDPRLRRRRPAGTRAEPAAARRRRFSRARRLRRRRRPARRPVGAGARADARSPRPTRPSACFGSTVPSGPPARPATARRCRKRRRRCSARGRRAGCR